MKTGSEKSSTPASTPAKQTTSQPFFEKSGGGGFFEPTTPAPVVQAKLSVNQPGDAHEQEADKMADKVMRMPVSGGAGETIQRKEEEKIQKAAMPEEKVQKKEDEKVQKKEEEKIQKAAMPEEKVQKKEEERIQKREDVPIQRKEGAGVPQTDVAGIAAPLQASKGGGSPLPAETKGSMESAFGADFSKVRVHTGPDATSMSKDINAQAFTHGNDIYFNEGRYNPGSEEGKRLLAHELTHTVQQGAVQRKAIQRAVTTVPTAPLTAPTHALDITQRFNPDAKWAAYLAEKTAKAEVLVKIGTGYEGKIRVNQKSRPTAAGTGKYELAKDKGKQALDVKGMAFLNPLRNANIKPVLVLDDFGESQAVKGFLSVMVGGVIVGNLRGLLEKFNSAMDQMGFLGLDKFKLEGIKIENTFENGRLLFNASGLHTVVGGFLTAGAGIGISGENLTFDAVAKVDVGGLATGDFNIKRGETGKIEGRGTIQASVSNVQASLLIEYLEGILTIQGTGTITSEKFTGSLTLLVTDPKRADEAMHTELGVQQVEQQAKSAKTPKPAAGKVQKQVLVAWGSVQAHITPWLAGTAKVGIDSKGHVTIVGEIAVPDEVKLMEQKGKKITLVNFELRAGYGIPLVGQIFIFGGIKLFINAGFGPLVLRNVKFTGQYSTDPSILQHFMITGSLGINAFAILGLEASAGVGITLIGHDIKAGLSVTAAAGIKAYAEATPSFEYVEKAGAKGGKVGEARLKGHFEAAAQLFLMLGGKFFVELDSPFWSPVPDENWDFPFGSVEYPIGNSMGIGADIDWLVGSPEAPELKFTPVEFNAEKFTADILADPPPGSGKGGDKDQKGKWDDKTGGGKMDKQAKTNEKTKGLAGNKKEDFTKLKEPERLNRALDELSKLAEKSKSNPVTLKVLQARMNELKAKYALALVEIRNKKKDESASVYMRAGKTDNNKNLLVVYLMSEKQRTALLEKANQEFQKSLTARAGAKKTITHADAEALGQDIAKKHAVIEGIRVVEGGARWDFELSLGDGKKVWVGMAKGEKELVKGGEAGKTGSGNINVAALSMHVKFTLDEGDSHELYFSQESGHLELMMASNNPDKLKKILEKELAENKTDTPAQENNLKQVKVLLQEIQDRLSGAFAHKDNLPEKGKKPDSDEDFVLRKLNEIKELLKHSGIGVVKDIPETVVKEKMLGEKAHEVEAYPLTYKSTGKGSPPKENPAGWDEIDPAKRADFWVKAHLLNEFLSGPGVKWNLVLGTKTTNSAMLHEAEKSLKKQVNEDKKIMYFKADVTYHSQPDAQNFPSEIRLQWGELLRLKGQYQKFAGGNRTFIQEPPNEALETIPSLNQSSANKLKKASQKAGQGKNEDLFNAIVDIRRKQPSGKFDNLMGLVKAMTDANPDFKQKDFSSVIKKLVLAKAISFDLYNASRLN